MSCEKTVRPSFMDHRHRPRANRKNRSAQFKSRQDKMTAIYQHDNQLQEATGSLVGQG
jgi:hypothetical protein